MTERKVSAVLEQETTGSAFRDGVDDLEDLERQARDTNRGLRKLDGTTEDYADQLAELESELRDVNSGLDRMERQVRDLNDSQDNAFGGLLSRVQTIKAGVAGVIGLLAGFSVGNLGNVVKVLTDLSARSLALRDDLNGVHDALSRNSDTSGEAKENFEFLKKTASDLGIVITELSEKYDGIDAATSRVEVSQKDVNAVFREVLEAGRLLKSSNEQIEKSIQGISNAAENGVLTLDIWGGIVDQLPGANSALALGLTDVIDGFDGTVDSMRDLIKEGKITAEVMIPALAKGLDKLLKTKAEDFFSQLSTQVGKLQNAGILAGAAFGDGLVPPLLRVLEIITPIAERSEFLARALGEGSGAGLNAVINSLTTDIQGMAAVLSVLQPTLLEFGDSIAESTGRLVGIRGLGDAFNTFLSELTGGSEKARTQFERMEDAAREAVTGIRRSEQELFDSVVEQAEKSAQVAGLTADERESIATELAARLKIIALNSAEERAALEKDLVSAAKEEGEAYVQEWKRVFEDRKAIEAADEKQRQAALRDQLAAIVSISAQTKSALEQIRSELLKADLVIDTSGLQASRAKIDAELKGILLGLDSTKEEILLQQDAFQQALSKFGDGKFNLLPADAQERVRERLLQIIGAVNAAGVQLDPVVKAFAARLQIPTEGLNTTVAEVKAILADLRDGFDLTSDEVQKRSAELKAALLEISKGGKESQINFGLSEEGASKLKARLEEIVEAHRQAGEKIDPIIGDAANKVGVLVGEYEIARDGASQLAGAQNDLAGSTVQVTQAVNDQGQAIKEVTTAQDAAAGATDKNTAAAGKQADGAVRVIEKINEQGKVIKEITTVQSEAASKTEEAARKSDAAAESRKAEGDAAAAAAESVERLGDAEARAVQETPKVTDGLASLLGKLENLSGTDLSALETQLGTVQGRVESLNAGLQTTCKLLNEVRSKAVEAGRALAAAVESDLGGADDSSGTPQ